MRVLIVNLGYPPNVIGGAELFVQSLGRELVRSGIEVSVASLSQRKSDWHYEDEGVRAYFLDAHPMGIELLNPQRTLLRKVLWHGLGEANIWAAGKLGAVIEREKPDIVHTHSLLGLSISAWRAVHARGIPIVHTLQDYQLLCPRGTMFRRGHPCNGQCRSCAVLTRRRRRASALPATVVGISNFILNAHLSHGYFPSASRSIIPDSFTPSSEVPTSECRSAGSEGPLRIGFIGRLHPTKGIEVLIEALRRLPRDQYVAKIAGSGSADYEARLRRLADGLTVEFLGWTRQEQFYRQIDVLVVPSTYHEPQGIVLVEAASFGVPTIYSKRGGLGELGGEFVGFHPFDPEQPNSLSDQLLRLSETPSAVRRARSAMGPPPASFGIERRAGEYRQLYENVLVLRGRPRSPSVRNGEVSSMGGSA